MIPVPEVKGVDMAFGNTDYLPKYQDIPEQFKQHYNPYCEFVSKWFFAGLKQADIDRLTAKDGVDKDKALMACQACLVSLAPKHEHKEAGVAYLLSEWFNLKAKE